MQSDCHALYQTTKFGIDSSNRFRLRARTHTNRHRQNVIDATAGVSRLNEFS